MLPVLGVLEVTDQELAWTGYLGRASKVLGGGPRTWEQETVCGQGTWKAQVPLAYEWPQSQTACSW